MEITTTKGRDLILIRLADAISELGSADGIRPHRSWWMARAAIARHDSGALILTDGRTVPVSRANRRSVQHWLGTAAR